MVVVERVERQQISPHLTEPKIVHSIKSVQAGVDGLRLRLGRPIWRFGSDRWQMFPVQREEGI